MKKYIIIALSIFSILLTSCDKDPVVTSLSLDKSTLALSQGATGQLTATIQPMTIPSTSKLGTVQWSSSNSAVATVANGIVTAISVGTAQIVASSGSVTATCNVTVSAAVTSVTLSKTSIRLKVDSTQTLTPTLLPAQSPDVVGNIIWTSTNPAVATVNGNGKITAVSNGSANIIASIGNVTAICSVTVYTTLQVLFSGSNYYLIYLNATDYNNYLVSDLVSADYRVDNVNNKLYIWHGGSTEGICSGTGFYGSSTSWLNLIITSTSTWWGGGFNVSQGTNLDKLAAVSSDVTNKYYFHLAIKSTTTNSYEFKLEGGATSVPFVLGTTSLDGITPYSNFARDGNWHEVEIPMSYFKGKGLSYTTGMVATNVFDILQVGTTDGVKIELDAIFIYKKP